MIHNTTNNYFGHELKMLGIQIMVHEWVVMMQSKLDNVFEKVDLTLLNRLLGIFVPYTADYMAAKNDATVWYATYNSDGIIRGLQFAPFIRFMYQCFALVLDLLIIGVSEASDIAGPPQISNTWKEFLNEKIKTSHPIRMHCGYVDNILLHRFNKLQAKELMQNFVTQNAHQNNENVVEYNSRRCWARDYRMRLMRHDLNLAVFWEDKKRLPRAVSTIKYVQFIIQIYYLICLVLK